MNACNEKIVYPVFFGTNELLFRPVGTGGAKGARAPPIFLGKSKKIYLEFCLFAWLLSVVHPLILAACYGPDVGLQKQTML